MPSVSELARQEEEQAENVQTISFSIPAGWSLDLLKERRALGKPTDYQMQLVHKRAGRLVLGAGPTIQDAAASAFRAAKTTEQTDRTGQFGDYYGG